MYNEGMVAMALSCIGYAFKLSKCEVSLCEVTKLASIGLPELW